MKQRIPGSTLSADPEKAKAWRRRSKGLARGKSRLKPNAERKKRRAEVGEVYGPHWRWVMTLDCLLFARTENTKWACEGKMDGHHVKTVGSGGKDAGNIVPLCWRHHRSAHALGPVRFGDRWDMDLFKIAKDLDVAEMGQQEAPRDANGEER